MNAKTTLIVSVVTASALALVGWQGWNTHRLQQQVQQLQQQLGEQGAHASVAAVPAPLAPSASAQTSPAPGAVPAVPPDLATPFGDEDPFADMQRIQQQMHQHMQQLLSGLGFDAGNDPLFDLDPFKGGNGFGSSMGFGAQPDFDFREQGDHYEIAISIPAGSNVEINTSVRGRDLTVEGKVTSDQQGKGQNGGFRSLQTRQFAQTFRLPADADPLGLVTRNDKDKVVVTLPKQAGKPRQLSGNGVSQPVL